jgi:hypothetical protein
MALEYLMSRGRCQRVNGKMVSKAGLLILNQNRLI